jgi:hypothetical protein
MNKIILAVTLLALALKGLSQNVGIGTTNPKARLHVTDSSVLFSGGQLVSLPALPPPVEGLEYV